MDFEGLVLSGGASKGFAILGAVQYLIDKGKLKNTKSFAGTSIGSVILYLFVIGYSGIEILIYLCSNNVIEKLNDCVQDKESWLDFVSEDGIFDYEIINKTLEDMTINKIKKIPTLNELYVEYNKELYFTTYNFTKHETIYLSYKTHPDLNCLKALRMSCNLPYIFSKFFYNDEEYMDGGVSNNFPINVLDNIHVLGISVSYKPFIGINKYMDRFFTLLMLPMNIRESEKIKKLKDNLVLIDIEQSLLLFDISNSQKLDLFSYGYNICKNVLDK